MNLKKISEKRDDYGLLAMKKMEPGKKYLAGCPVIEIRCEDMTTLNIASMILGNYGGTVSVRYDKTKGE
jgi:hypothetical protein